ncbi:MAG: PKD domain-containing protein, partial [Tepidisphaeraceae bacterium]
MARRDLVGTMRASCILASVAKRSIANLTNPFQTLQRCAGGRSSRPALPIEPLEQRRMLASVDLSGGILSLTGNNGMRNTMTVMRSGTSNYVAKVGSLTRTVSASSVSQIRITGGNWNDTITIDSGITEKSLIKGMDGNDSIKGGGGADSIYGNAGNDTLLGNAGNDVLYGEAGNDRLDGGSGTDLGDGGSGTDTVLNIGGTPTGSAGGSLPGATSITVSALQLWNSGSNTFIKTLSNGETLDLTKLPSTLTVVAQTSGTVASVRFGLDSTTTYRMENSSPWSITGDYSGGDLENWTVPTGTHTIKATPYTSSNGGGTAGTSKSISLNITRSSSTTDGGSTGGTTTGGTTTGTTGITPRNSSASAPNAIISSVSATSIHAGQSFHANAMSSQLNNGTPLTARYVWDFGDSGSKYNVLQGFNAAHLYSKPGTYTVKLTLTNEAGKTDTATTIVNVQSEGRKKIYVSNDGSDSNDGLSESRSIKSFSKAISKLGDNVEILFKGGQTFDVKQTMNVHSRNVVVGSYGSGKGVL